MQRDNSWLAAGATAGLLIAATILLIRRRRNGDSPLSRKPLACAACTEHFLNANSAAAVDLSTSVAEGHSILLLHNHATSAEVEALRMEASNTAAAESLRPATDKTRPWWSLQEVRGRMRLPIEHAFGEATRNRCDQLLVRAVTTLHTHAPKLVPILFEDRLDAANATTLIHDEKVIFSPREPAINVYTERGRFKPHKDHEVLTVLVPLSAPDAFDGGGTCFWSLDQLDKGVSPLEKFMTSPRLVLTPPPGTAIVFAGCITHAARAVKGGERCVLVASFSPADDEEEEQEAQPR